MSLIIYERTFRAVKKTTWSEKKKIQLNFISLIHVVLNSTKRIRCQYPLSVVALWQLISGKTVSWIFRFVSRVPPTALEMIYAEKNGMVLRQ